MELNSNTTCMNIVQSSGKGELCKDDLYDVYIICIPLTIQCSRVHLPLDIC